MWRTLRHLLEFVRFSHTVFALPFALLSAVLAWREVPFRWRDLAGLLLCMIFARAAAMAFNRIADRQFDAENPRTRQRHLPAGILSLRGAVLFTLLCSAAFVLSTLLFWPNDWPLLLSLPVLMFLFGYSYAKRFTAWCHYWLSAALMLSPLAAWLAVTGRLDWSPVWLAGVIFFWVGGFDILYACQDVEFDRQRRLFSIPARWGVANALWVARCSHLLAVGALAGLWHAAALGTVFLAGTFGVALLLLYEHLLVRADDLQRVNVAFFQVNAVISIGVFLLGLTDVLLMPP